MAISNIRPASYEVATRGVTPADLDAEEAARIAADAVIQAEITAAREGEASLDAKLDLMETATTAVTNEVIAAREGSASLDAKLDLMETATTAVTDQIGISSISSVAGTGAAYTGVADKDPVSDGYWFSFTPHLTNTSAGPTLALNGGTARAIATRTGTLPAGGLVAGVPTVLRYSSGNVFRLYEPIDTPVARVQSVAGTGTAYTGTVDFVPVVSNALLIEFTPHVTNTGSCTLAINGGSAVLLLTADGAAIPAGKLTKNGRYLGWYLSAGIFIIGLVREGPANERVIEANERQRRESAREFTMEIGGQENSPLFVTGTIPYWIASAGDNGRLIYVAGMRIIDLQLVPVGSGVPIFIYVAAGGGNEAKLFEGAGRKTLTAAAGSLVQVLRPAEEVFVVTALLGTVTEGADVSAPAPARTLTIITGGQSLARGWMLEAGFHGLQLGLADLGWTPTIWPVQGADGGSGITADSNPTNYWWIPSTSSPGPSALAWKAALDAIPAAQPEPAAIYWCFGQSDATSIGTDFSIAEYADYLRDLFAWMRTQAGNLTLPIIISPIGSQEAVVPTDAQFAAIRWVEMVIAEDENIHLGPSLYDLPHRFYDSHPSHEGQKLQGYRLAKTLNNLLHGGTDNLGPYVSKVEELDSGARYRLTVEQSQAGTPFTRYTENNGFAVLPSGSDPISGTPIPITSQYWELLSGKWSLNLVLESASVDATIVYPWGNMSEVNTGRYVADSVYWKVGGSGLQNHQPLREFAGKAGTPPVSPTIP